MLKEGGPALAESPHDFLVLERNLDHAARVTFCPAWNQARRPQSPASGRVPRSIRAATVEDDLTIRQ
jgi:hypothetical protein